MARSIILSNGEMHVGLNNFGLVHDFYYPYVGGENHALAQALRHRIGVWVDGAFSWLDDGAWEFRHAYVPETLIGNVTATNHALEITLEMTSAVDHEQSAFIRNMHVINMSDHKREIRLFMHQVFVISNSYASDTSQYLPDSHAIVHYKGLRSFIVSGRDNNGEPFDQYAIGLNGIEGKAGVYKDAEDGELSGNNVEHGRVDSVFRFRIELNGHDSTHIQYWIAAGKSQREALVIHKRLQSEGIETRISSTGNFWHNWLEPARSSAQKLDSSLQESFLQSVLLAKAHIDTHGAVIASTDTTMLNYSRDTYAYCWPRDAAHVLWPLIRLGFKDEPLKFFAFCRRILHPHGYLMHKYQPDGALGPSWHPYVHESMTAAPIQEDETAIVLFIFAQYYALHPDKKLLQDFYGTMVRPMADFLASYVDDDGMPLPTYDLWERLFLTTTFTVSVVYAGLIEAARLADAMDDSKSSVRWQTAAETIQRASPKLLYDDEQQSFIKGYRREADGSLHRDTTVDLSSMHGAYMFGLFDIESPQVQSSFKTATERLKTSDNHPALARFQDDEYDRADPSRVGNPWYVTTLWYAQYLLETNKPAESRTIVDWVQSRMTSTGVLSEQFHPDTLASISVAPLAWSQAEYLSTLLDMITEPVEIEV